MKLRGILNRGINEVLAQVGHGQILIVCDAGFPVPSHVRCIDLSIKRNIPTLETVLETITEEFITEKVMYARQVAHNNNPLYSQLKRIFPDCEHELVAHEDILGNIASQAVAVIRTGAYNPWGNIALVSGTDPFAWFNDPEVKAPPFYEKRIQTILESGMRDKYHTN